MRTAIALICASAGAFIAPPPGGSTPIVSMNMLGLAAASGTHPAKALIERAAAAVRSDPQRSRRDAQAALALLAQRPDAELEIRAQLLLCDYFSERDRGVAEAHAGRARELLPLVQRQGLQAGVLNCAGAILETVGDNERAGELYDQAVAVAEQTGDREMLAAALYSRGYLQGLRARYAAALMDLKRAQAIYEQIGLPHHALTSLNGIAIMYNRMGDYAQARDIYAEALKEQRAAGMYREVSVTLHNLGRAHENLLQWNNAQEAFQQALKISRGLKYERGEAYALRGLASVAIGQGDPKGALTILDRAAELQRRTPDARLDAQIQLARGIALHHLNELPESAAALIHALDIFEQAESHQELLATYSELAAVQAAMGQWQQGYLQLLSAQKTAERLFRNQIDQRFATLKVEFDTAGKDKENALLLRENLANQNALAQARRARHLQAAVIVLTAMLTVLLATLAIHQWRTTRRMRVLAMTDELTGVPNRRAVLSRLPALLKQSASRCSLLIIDIDYFKRINDEHGHSEGDEALKLVAARLREGIREPASIGRLGGEEFVVLLPDTRIDEACALAERFRQQIMAIDTRRWAADRRITVSIGVTMSLALGDTPSAMLQRADAALYDAKRTGRNCVRVRLSAHECKAENAPADGPVDDRAEGSGGNEERYAQQGDAPAAGFT
ncbi:diguanylate cyclase [Steroidobacter denitrificans]|nr:diguanylate cyclase [Steroidobacter denitrificans]